MKTCPQRHLRLGPGGTNYEHHHQEQHRYDSGTARADRYARPGKTAVVQAMTPDPAARRGPRPAAGPFRSLNRPRGCRRWCSTTATTRPASNRRACTYYVRVLRSPGAFHDGARRPGLHRLLRRRRGCELAPSPTTGSSWDTEEKVSGIAANGYHVVCALETANRLRILCRNPDVPNQPYAMAGLRTAVCDPSVDPAAFTGDAPCAGDLVTEGSVQVWNRGRCGPSFLWYNPLPTSAEGQTFHLALRHAVHRLDRRQRQPRSGLLRRRGRSGSRSGTARSSPA
ncbi:MAG: hypothetical protein MZV70_52300 [Desulfobacterales bacterium]|nr:hypothetical protein [Desulfobacterales bacterium]